MVDAMLLYRRIVETDRHVQSQEICMQENCLLDRYLRRKVLKETITYAYNRGKDTLPFPKRGSNALLRLEGKQYLDNLLDKGLDPWIKIIVTTKVSKEVKVGFS